MKNRLLLVVCGLVTLVVLAACGGGGGGGNGGTTPTVPADPATPVTPAATNKITGVASKAPINGGDVKAYKVVADKKGDLIVSGKTASDGSYTLDLGSYSGPVIIEVTGGSYTDEATGNVTSIPVASPMHTVVPNASGTISAAITPLTELAFQQAGTTLNAATIANANNRVASMFNLNNIVQTLPVAPTAAALNVLSTTDPAQIDQKNYTLVLATLSQLAASQTNSIAATVAYLNQNVSGSGTSLNATAVKAIQSAATTFFTANTNNATNITNVSNTNLATIGARKATLTLATTGVMPSGNSIKGLAAEITLPQGVTVKSDTSGVLASYLFASGIASPSLTLMASVSGNKLNFGFTDATGIAVGAFATLLCDVTVDAPATLTKNDFVITSGYKISDTRINIGTQSLSPPLALEVKSVVVE